MHITMTNDAYKQYWQNDLKAMIAGYLTSRLLLASIGSKQTNKLNEIHDVYIKHAPELKSHAIYERLAAATEAARIGDVLTDGYPDDAKLLSLCNRFQITEAVVPIIAKLDRKQLTEFVIDIEMMFFIESVNIGNDVYIKMIERNYEMIAGVLDKLRDNYDQDLKRRIATDPISIQSDFSLLRGEAEKIGNMIAELEEIEHMLEIEPKTIGMHKKIWNDIIALTRALYNSDYATL